MVWRGTRTIAYSVGNLGKDIQATDCAVDLSPRMISHNDSCAADFVCLQSICDVLDAFQDEGPTARDVVPLRVQLASVM